MATPQYRLIYFNARGRAEHIRFIFAHAGVEYEDVRVSREQWVEMKSPLFQWRAETEPAQKEARKRELMRDTVPFYLGRFERIVTDNGGYAVAGQLTWADFMFAVSLENFELLFGSRALEAYPSLRALKERVFALPRIQAWVQRRPVTEF